MDTPAGVNQGRVLVETIKEKVSIVDIISRYVVLTAGGKNLKGNCPLHGEKTPSFYVSPSEGYWKCFGCGKGGDVVTFIQEIEKVSFREALVYLAEIAGVSVRMNARASEQGSQDTFLYSALKEAKDVYIAEFQQNTDAQEYMHSRGVTPDSIQRFQIGYAPDNWQKVYTSLRTKYSDEQIIASGLGIQGKRGVYDRFRSRVMFPTHDMRDRVITFSGRLWSVSGEFVTERADAGKYVNGPETSVYHKSQTLFGLNLARQSIVQKKSVLVVEGHLDCVLAHQLGYTETVAVGGTALTDEHADVIKRYCSHIVLAFDADGAGQKAILRSLPVLLKHGFTVAIVRLPAGQDPADCIQKTPAQFRLAVDNAQEYTAYRLQSLQLEGASLVDIDRVLKQEIYPLLAGVHNPLLVDAAVKTISRSIGVSNDSIIREHIRSSTPAETAAEHNGKSTDKTGSVIKTRDWAVRLIVVWTEVAARSDTVDAKVAAYLQGAAGITVNRPVDLSDMYAILESEYRMQFEWLYGNQDPYDILPVVIRQFSQAYVQDQTQAHLLQLQKELDPVDRDSVEQFIVNLSHYKRFIEQNPYAN